MASCHKTMKKTAEKQQQRKENNLRLFININTIKIISPFGKGGLSLMATGQLNKGHCIVFTTAWNNEGEAEKR